MAQFQIVRKEAQRVVCFEFWSEWSECAPMVPQVQSMIPPNPPTQMSPAVPPSPARPTVPSPSLVRPFFLLRRSKIQHFSRDPAAIRWIVPSSPRSGLERPAGARYGPPSQPTAHSLEKVVEFFSQLGSSRSQLQLYVVPGLHWGGPSQPRGISPVARGCSGSNKLSLPVVWIVKGVSQCEGRKEQQGEGCRTITAW